MRIRPTTLLLAAVLGLPATARLAAASDPLDEEGKRVFRKANCIGCHKWHGDGGGGYGGDALSLRHTELDRDEITKTIECGRVGAGMPYHRRGAYDDPAQPCGRLGREKLGVLMPPEPTTYLRPAEVQAVVAYILDAIKGKGQVTYADCRQFWGEGSRMCDIYRNDVTAKGTAPGG